ncbi:MAG: hypothetical protein ACREDX_05225 [Aestuariivirga sp.]
MKITAIRATPVNIPFHAPYRFSYGSIASLTKTVTELVTDENVVGLGECADDGRPPPPSRPPPAVRPTPNASRTA